MKTIDTKPIKRLIIPYPYLLGVSLTLLLLITNINSSFATTSIEEALSSALRNNPDIDLERSRFETVKATKGDAISEFLPDIKATYQKGRQKNDAVGLDRGELDQMNDQRMQQINLNQPIFNGFQGYNKSQEISNNIKSAKEYYNFKKDQILLSAIEAYLNLYKAKKILKRKIDNEENSEKLSELIRQRNQLGEVGGSEVISYQGKLSYAISQRITAKKELFKAKTKYRKIIGDIDDDVLLPEVQMDKIAQSPEDLITLAINNNSNLKQYGFKIKSSRASLNKSKGVFSPKVELSASTSKQDNVTYLNNRDLKSRSIYLNVSIPLFQKGVEYFGVNKANKALSFAKKEYQSTKETLVKDVKQTYDEFIFYGDILLANQELIELNESKIQNMDQQVRIGQGDVIDLLNSKNELNSILEQKITYQADYILSYYKLLSLIGHLES